MEDEQPISGLVGTQKPMPERAVALGTGKVHWTDCVGWRREREVHSDSLRSEQLEGKLKGKAGSSSALAAGQRAGGPSLHAQWWLGDMLANPDCLRTKGHGEMSGVGTG